jgi:hypothetical protein
MSRVIHCNNFWNQTKLIPSQIHKRCLIQTGGKKHCVITKHRHMNKHLHNNVNFFVKLKAKTWIVRSIY